MKIKEAKTFNISMDENEKIILEVNGMEFYINDKEMIELIDPIMSRLSVGSFKWKYTPTNEYANTYTEDKKSMNELFVTDDDEVTGYKLYFTYNELKELCELSEGRYQIEHFRKVDR